MKRLKVLVACEESQAVCKEFRCLGHEAYSCDILPCSGGHPEWHIQGDVTELLKQKWDVIIAFPPCTYLSNAGACRLYPSKGVLNQERYNKGLDAKEFFLKFYNHSCKYIAIENPVSSTVYNMPTHTQEIQPYWFGHSVTKKTRLWLWNLPTLKPTCIVNPVGSYVPSQTSKRMSNSKGIAKRGDDSKNRSKTFPGIAKAMAEQWSDYITSLS